MTRKRLGRLTNRKQILPQTLFTTLLVSLSFASPAVAVPKGAFAAFADCPVNNPAVFLCVSGVIESGEIVLGRRAMAIVKPMTMQLGLVAKPQLNVYSGAAAADGNTISRAPQPVPGGLLGVVAPQGLPGSLRNLFDGFLSKGITGVEATTELAVPAGSIVMDLGNLAFEEGSALLLPVKVKLENPFLGSGCYVGSSAHPLTLELRTGTTSPPAPNKPIKGTLGKASGQSFPDESEIIFTSGTSLVDNSFAVPAASGCGGSFSSVVDSAVNAELGLPAAAGRNTMILGSRMALTQAASAKAHE